MTIEQMLGVAPPPEAETLMGVLNAERSGGEDCLVLNVWTPALETAAHLPVLVWLHGGGWDTGSASWPLYDFTNLARNRDVVVVGLNHRLGVLGFLDLSQYGEEYADSGNIGMLDIVAALEWIRDNIRQFGGDPDNVTVFGESGGGAKTSTLLAMPAAWTVPQGVRHERRDGRGADARRRIGERRRPPRPARPSSRRRQDSRRNSRAVDRRADQPSRTHSIGDETRLRDSARCSGRAFPNTQSRPCARA